MNEGTMVDARGLSCPEPVLRTREALKRVNKGVVTVLVDTDTARENVSRLARNSSWRVTIEREPDGSSRLVLEK